MHKEALYCDGTVNYVFPPEPQKDEYVSLFFRTAKGRLTYVYLITENETLRLKKVYSKGLFDYYKTILRVDSNPIRYYFKIIEGTEMCYYNRFGVMDEIIDEYSFELIPDFKIPTWANGAVMYQIYVDRFYNGNSDNDVRNREYYYLGDYSKQVTDWNSPPQTENAVGEFYGGDLQGVIDKLDYLEELGVEVLYLNPIFVSPSNHKYDIQDYESVDPHFGVIVNDSDELLEEGDTDNRHAKKYRMRTTNKENLEASNDLLALLSEELHKRNMKLILDGVFNHCGSFNKWIDREKIYENQDGYDEGAFLSYNSPYKDYFKFSKSEPTDWPDNESYEGWWGHSTLPKLNYEDNARVENKILSIGKKWIGKPYNVDGWRLDVAADLGATNETNHAFWKMFRKTIKKENPEALILAEHYGDPNEWLKGDEWDTVMNYDAFMEPVSWFLTGMEKHSDESRPELKGNGQYFADTIRHNMAKMPTQSLYSAMNELSNHDHSRFLTRTNQMVGRVEHLSSIAASYCTNDAIMRIAVVMQMTWIGAPTIYYGDEAGVCGFTDPDNRRTYPWGHEDVNMIAFHKDVIRIHKEERTLKTGCLKLLCQGNDLVSYARFDISEQIVVVVNSGDSLREIEVPVWQGEVPEDGKLIRLLYTYDEGYVVDGDELVAREGSL
ncbi:MAG: glycoside hydrolase family 13 protein [Suipraeoptans sp.]